MKYSTAISRLTDVVDGLDRAAEWPDTTVTAAFVFGIVLDGAADRDGIEVALVVAEAPEVVPFRQLDYELLGVRRRFDVTPSSRPAASASRTGWSRPPAAVHTRTARSISWFQTGYFAGRHCHKTGSSVNRNTAASASRCAGRDIH
jgi:hypothetical protein